MKKIIFSTMIACLLAFVGCQNEELVNENTNNGGEKVILTANIQGAADSRVALTPYTENGATIVKVAWNERGEKFKVYGYDSEYSDYYGTPTWFTQIEGTNQFEGELPDSDNGTYLAVYGDDRESATTPLHYSLDEQDGTLTDCQSISTENGTSYLHYVLMRDIIDDLSSPIEFEHETAILKPTFKVGVTDIDNTITQIVMGNVIFPTTGNGGIEEITIIPTSSATTLAGDIYIHLPMAYIKTVFEDGKYPAGHQFSFKVTDNQGNNYTGSLTIRKSIEAGKLYTADIALTEVITYCYLPSGAIFNAALCDILDDNSTVTAIEFVAGSNLEDTEVYDENVSSSHVELNYKIVNNTLQLHTRAHKFRFDNDCSGMFSGSGSTRMSEINSIKFNGCIHTSNVTDMRYMFGSCSSLTTIDLSSFDTSKVTNMNGMFSGCTSLTSLDLSSFNTSLVESMINMFASSGLQSITFGESFNTYNVTSMMRMFENCSALTTINFRGFNTPNVINFNTLNVTSMISMFSGCSSLTTLDLSSFTAVPEVDMYMMFNSCTNLEELHLQNFVPTTTEPENYRAMFKNVGSGLPSGSKTKIYVATDNPFNEYAITRFDAEKAEYIEVSQNN